MQVSGLQVLVTEAYTHAVNMFAMSHGLHYAVRQEV